MVLVDSSVWIDYFRGKTTPEADRLDALLGREPVAAGDLIVIEVLQGFASDRDFDPFVEHLGLRSALTGGHPGRSELHSFCSSFPRRRESSVFSFNGLKSLDPRLRGDDCNYSDLP